MNPVGFDRPITEKGVRSFFLWSWITKRDALIYPKFCEIRDSFARNDFAASLGTVPQLEEVGFDVEMPEFSDFNDYRVTWTNRLFKAKFSLSRSLLDFDLTGQSRRLLDSLAARVANWPDLLFITRLQNATATVSYESGRNGVGEKFFFSTTHDLGDGNSQDNLLSGNTTTAYVLNTAQQTVALQLQTDFNTAIATMRGYKDDKGQPWHPTIVQPGRLVILCSPLLANAFEIAFGANLINQTTNMFQGKVEVVSTPYLPISGAEAADWYMFYIGPNTNRAFVYSRYRRIQDSQIEDFMSLNRDSGDSNRFGPTTMDALREFSSIEIQTNLGSRGTNSEADVILNERYLFGARWLGEIFPLVWQNCIKVDNAAS